ncbi:BZ3500_MvSof-1268-A1-R1_Chr3-1g06054 [Microbotryum saponariae]|uniref:ATP-dependent DNA helicase CHL1 n=1 Tax=Microbotryum saponariae TaxID=289078 RepID=A0A2X0LAE4_9BASI|nr:BZ3500_MvSof-1268-A1-R1_Chr3-1g06054 [Microbotryum saponariae]SDA03871.1 BZ3501_MvSof-1269-A2-R1_Chr3-2g05739 [Microbotryum saponariae]
MTPSHAATPPDGAAPPPTTTTIDYAPSDPSFSFPYTAYSIQQELMQHLYQALARSQVTVIESPTGTGKSLSLISASLTFLRDAKHHARTSLIETIQAQVRADSGSKDEPDWVLEHEIQSRLKAWEREESELEQRLEEIRKKEEELRKLMPSGAAQMGRRKRNVCEKSAFTVKSVCLMIDVRLFQRIDGERGPDSKPSEDEFAPEPYYETEQDTHKVDDNGPDNFSPAVRAMLAKINGRGSTGPEQEEPDVQKIYFASRTHSQLSQFIAELRKTPFSHSTPIPDAPEGSPTSIPPIRVIPLGSRQNLCINDEMRNKSHGSNEVLGDLCLELQKGSTEEKRCPYLPPMSEPTKLNDFRDRALTQVGDIEDIEDLGRRTKTCPYYGSRKAVRSAQLVTLPYNMLMSKAAREALGVSVKDHIIIVDEAHNLIDSILQLHSVSITTSQITSIRAALLTYLTKFKTRLNGANAAYLRQLALLLRGLAEYAMSWANERVKGKKKEEMVGVNALFQSRGGAVGGGKGAIDQVNLFKLDQYLKTSKIARKEAFYFEQIGGYVDSLAEETTAAGRQAVRTNATRNLQRIQKFILSLASSEKDGRILLSTEPKPVQAGQVGPEKVEVTLKYMLLAPSESFKDVTEEARSVVLAGGTMEPMSDFRDQLFPYLPSERFSTFSCGHVVPPDHIACFAVSKGPTGGSLEFKFDRRKDEKLLDELGHSIVNLTNVIPHGIVVFVPSYDFLFQIQARWEKTNLITRLGSRKKVFWEPKSSSEVDLILRDYSAAITTPPSKGAILFAVVGAKLSEGINFANEMARAVIICGIPYPNAQSTELKERMNFLKTTAPKDSKIDPGQTLYQNLAFRAVNQSIGRAIRNSTDWAAIILLDARYQQVSKQTQLPRWLGQDVRNVEGFGQLMKEVVGFVKRRKGVEG